MTVSAAALAELHRIHRQLTDLRSRLAKGPQQIKIAQLHVDKVEQEMATAKEEVQRARINSDQKELQLAEREGRIVDIKSKLNACSTNREYQAFLEQIAADEQANSVLSDEILELLDRITELEAVVEEVNQRRSTVQLERETIQQRVDEAKVLLETDVARLLGELQVAEDKLPADFRKDYQRLVNARGEEALAPLDGQTCGGCYQMVTTQTVNELMMSKPVFCKACGCLLYFNEGGGADADAPE